MSESEVFRLFTPEPHKKDSLYKHYTFISLLTELTCIFISVVDAKLYTMILSNPEVTIAPQKAELAENGSN